MKNIILFDDDNWEALLPLTFTKPICELRIGILTIREKWEIYLNAKATYITQEFLSEKFPIEIYDENLVINSTVLPTPALVDKIKNLKSNESILWGDELIAARLSASQFDALMEEGNTTELSGTDISSEQFSISRIGRPYDIFQYNDQEIRADYALLTKNRTSAPLSNTNTCIQAENIFVEEGAKVECAILNASTGPIYIAKDAEIMEGSIIRGPFALCEHGVVKMGAKIYGATTIGPHSKVGGEISNSVLQAYSNKGHDGFLGNSVLGEWCNLGADTNTSNLKNNYELVKLWSYEDNKFVSTGLQFCGLIMGDHSKTGINTMLNTGTVIGIHTNIYGDGFPRNFVPSFAWGGAAGFQTYILSKAIDTAKRVMMRRNIVMSEIDEKIYEHIFNLTTKYRPWEKV